MKKTIYLIRHGESTANVSSKFLGPESPLTDVGNEQAKLLADRATRLEFDVLIASPYTRTRQTAEKISAATGHTAEYSELFRERELPLSTRGREKSDLEARAIADAAILSSEGYAEKVEDAETFAELVERADEAMHYLENRPEANILVVGHGFFSRILIARVLYKELLTPETFRPFVWGWRTKNTGLSVLHFDPNDEHCTWWMSVWNDHSHLG